MADTSSMTGDDLVGQLQQWCVDQAAKSAYDLKMLESRTEVKLKDLEGRMNNLSLNIATQVATDVNIRLENCMKQTKLDIKDFKGEIYEEIKTAVNESMRKCFLRAANAGMAVDDEQPSRLFPCESTPMCPNSTPLPECSLEQQAEPPRQTRFVQSLEDLSTEWSETLSPFWPKQHPKGERLNRVQVAFLNYMITKKDLKGNKDCAQYVIKEGRNLNLWSSVWKPQGITTNFQDYMVQKILNITKRAKLGLSRRRIDLDKMNADLEKRTNSLLAPAEGECTEETDTEMEV